MARPKELIVRREEISPVVKPEVSQRPAALFSEIEDPQERLRLVTEWYRENLAESPIKKKTGDINPLLEEKKRRQRELLIKRRQAALELATSQKALEPLIKRNNEMLFAAALSRVRRNQRPAVYQAAVTACMKETAESADPKASRQAGRTLRRLIDLDDSQGKRLSREAIRSLEETAPEMFAVAVRSLSASSLSQIADAAMLDVCSPRQTATLIGMAAGKLYAGATGSGIDITGERRQGPRVPLERLLDQVVERDNAALTDDLPDFGFAEAVVKSLTRANRPTFTVCQLVRLANRLESAGELVSLLAPGLVQQTREMLANFNDDGTFPDDLAGAGGNPDYFSIT